MNYSQIIETDIANGNGVRVTLFVSGCGHKCHNCQNPETWDRNFGNQFTAKTKEYLFKCLDKPYIDGITITGGDSLYKNNLSDVLNLVNQIRTLFPQKTIWLYSGFYWEEIFEPTFGEQSQEWIDRYLKDCEIRKAIIRNVDVMIDGRYVDSQRDVTLKWRGSKNQSVIDVKKSLNQNEAVLYCD